MSAITLYVQQFPPFGLMPDGDAHNSTLTPPHLGEYCARAVGLGFKQFSSEKAVGSTVVGEAERLLLANLWA